MTAAIVTMALTGLAAGAGLAFASKFFKTERDPRLELIENCLPGVNCGGCGYPGCSSLAIALVSGEALPGACLAAAPEAAERIRAILGAEAGERKSLKVFLKCGGGKNCSDRYDYSGPEDCLSMTLASGGRKKCPYGCLGGGSCVKACPFGAITVKDGLATIENDKCVGCGTCVEACPKGLLEIIEDKGEIAVACSSKDRGAEVRKYCSAGCIGCRMCEKICPSGAAILEGFLARIDPEKCSRCGACLTVCPTGAIKNNVNK